MGVDCCPRELEEQSMYYLVKGGIENLDQDVMFVVFRDFTNVPSYMETDWKCFALIHLLVRRLSL